MLITIGEDQEETTQTMAQNKLKQIQQNPVQTLNNDSNDQQHKRAKKAIELKKGMQTAISRTITISNKHQNNLPTTTKNQNQKGIINHIPPEEIWGMIKKLENKWRTDAGINNKALKHFTKKPQKHCKCRVKTKALSQKMASYNDVDTTGNFHKITACSACYHQQAK